jgi:hypothetical protein
MIRTRFDFDVKSIELLELIRFEFLSCNEIEDFILWSCEHFEQLNISILLWKRFVVVCHCSLRIS